MYSKSYKDDICFICSYWKRWGAHAMWIHDKSHFGCHNWCHHWCGIYQSIRLQPVNESPGSSSRSIRLQWPHQTIAAPSDQWFHFSCPQSPDHHLTHIKSKTYLELSPCCNSLSFGICIITIWLGQIKWRHWSVRLQWSDVIARVQ